MSERSSPSTRALNPSEINFANFILREARVTIPDFTGYVASSGREYFLIYSDRNCGMRKIMSARYLDPRDKTMAFIDLLTSEQNDGFEISIWKPEASTEIIIAPDPSEIEFSE